MVSGAVVLVVLLVVVDDVPVPSGLPESGTSACGPFLLERRQVERGVVADVDAR